MAFIRSKKVKGRVYFQLVENCLKNGKMTQKVIKHLGNEDKAKKYCKERNITFLQKPSNKEIKGFFNSEREAAEFATALKGRKEAPIKFIYLKEGAELWKQLTEAESYKISKLENALLDESMGEITKEISDKYNVIDMGCGTGKNATIVIKKIQREFQPKYCALDISKEMLKQASEYLEKQHSKLNSEYHQIDFEEGNFAYLTENLHEKNYKTNLLMILTNTLGNVVDRSRVLANIRESMTTSDYLLIGIELFDIKRTQDILEQYSTDSVIKKIMFNVLRSHGVNEDMGKWEVNFNINKSQVEGRFTPKKNILIRVGRRRIIMKKGKSLLLMVSYKATPKSLQIMLADSGFIIKRLFLTPNEDYALLLCKPVQW